MRNAAPNVLSTAVTSARSGLVTVAFFSFFINLLMLSGPLYMLQVYDRVLPSGSMETLIALSILLLGLFVVSGCLELVRTRILSRIGAKLESRAASGVFNAVMRKRAAQSSDDGEHNLADLDTIKEFYSGQGLSALFDLPWVPVYLLLLTVLHPALGALGAAGALFLFLVAWINNRMTRSSMRRQSQADLPGRAIASASEKNAQLLQSMGMMGNLRRAWMTMKREANIHQRKSNDRSGFFSTLSKTSRLLLQSAVLGLGAALVIGGEITAGAMIAGTIILGRGLAPVDQSIAHWRSYLASKAAHRRLQSLLEDHPEPAVRLSHAEASQSLDVRRLFAGPPGARKAIVSDIDFTLEAGDVLAVIGPSASGKSTLARLLAGVWQPQAGTVRLDNVALEQLHPDELGPQIGYLPQSVELFDGTVAENIARFAPDASSMEIIAASEAAGLHRTILQMPDGYDTMVGDSGRSLSGGQRQRIGLARALFRNPFLVVLDEPNSSLDAEGDIALIEVLEGIRERGGIAVVISHRPNLVECAGKVLILDGGRQRAFGPRAAVLEQNVERVNPAMTRALQNPNVTSITQKAV